MGRSKSLGAYKTPARPVIERLPEGLVRRKPRAYAEWRALRGWKRLPPWEPEPPGFLLRLSREEATLTQAELARRLGTSQQAIAQAERWNANPTVDFLRRWARACGGVLRIAIEEERKI
jgi:DNA-binding XRE family transcriptional regulator